MIRREFIASLGSAVAAWPLAARAQQPGRMRRVGVLMSYDEDDPEAKAYLSGLRRDLRSWVGPIAATCTWTFAGPPATLTGCGCPRKSCSTSNPT